MVNPTQSDLRQQTDSTDGLDDRIRELRSRQSQLWHLSQVMRDEIKDIRHNSLGQGFPHQARDVQNDPDTESNPKGVKENKNSSHSLHSLRPFSQDFSVGKDYRRLRKCYQKYRHDIREVRAISSRSRPPGR
jgi:hypothetical protein